MKIKVLLIAPYAGLKELALRLTKEQDELEVMVSEGDLEEAVAVAHEIGSERFDMVISRGGTAKLLREHIEQPVIEIPLSGYDILRALTLIKDYNDKVEMVAFPNICQGVNAVSNLLDIHIPYSVIEHPRDVSRLVLEAKKKGVKLIMGDTITIKTAKHYGLQGILITSGRESILEAFHQARQLYSVLQKYQKHGSMLETIIDQSGGGVAVVNLQGDIDYCNTLFINMWGMGENVSNIPLSSDILHGLKMISPIMDFQIITFKTVIQGQELVCQIQRFDNEKYLLETNRVNKQNEDFVVDYLWSSIHSFAQIPGKSSEITNVVNQAMNLKDEKIWTVYGEKGVGKKTLAFATRGESQFQHHPFLVVTITRASDNAYKALKQLFAKSENVILYVQGVHLFNQAQQIELADLTRQIKNEQIIYSFYDDPRTILEPKFLNIFSKHILYIPPLRERVEDLDEYIRLFIGQFNEKYGKQIAGIHHHALELLMTAIWEGNVRECERLVEGLVQRINGEYIHSQDVKHVLSDSSIQHEIHVDSEDALNIDVSRSLEDIEIQIIMHVLQLENMNQTKTAKRLGITRATLWRKLKKYEQMRQFYV